ncbi:MAG: bifunctional 5,10-methylenetetrahydrofolate dehydrogenase/5,10-methenyltetrahydrofolate cyclohydrolase [Flavobacteriales bacterium]|nr:bifunctional 5,10-methylenetetrahydrofolate dehydrogenase/5,10-methenyltetrahydrofolate cyclohydrolase [Flavobacteriales bacterium]
MQRLNGVEVAKTIKEQLKEKVSELQKEGKRVPHLAAIIVGNDGASMTYVNSKENDCKQVGFNSTVMRFEESTSEETLLSTIEQINSNSEIDGLIVQLPLPKHISELKVTQKISPEKDVDGFHTVSLGKLLKGEDTFIPATPYGILMMLEQYNIETSGKHCVVVGRSNIVGRPMSVLMSQNTPYGNCTVTLCHSRTRNLEHYVQQADIVVAALGKPGFIKGSMLKKGAIVIDVGITRVEDSANPKGYVLKGDVDFDDASTVASAITPVPGGVGPLTRIGLLKNTFKSYQNTNN